MADPTPMMTLFDEGVRIAMGQDHPTRFRGKRTRPVPPCPHRTEHRRRLRHRPQLCETALAYLDTMSSPQTAATILGVHANTVTQRLNRMDRLFGNQWGSALDNWKATPRSG